MDITQQSERVANVALVRQLHRCEFLEQAQNVVLVGRSGTGKTNLATAFDVQALEQHRRRVLLSPTIELVNALEPEKTCDKQGQIAHGLAYADLVILDELAHLTFSQAGGALLFHLLSKLDEKSSMAITTKLSFAEWAAEFVDPTMTATLRDRLTHDCHIIETGNATHRFKHKNTQPRKEPRARKSSTT